MIQPTHTLTLFNGDSQLTHKVSNPAVLQGGVLSFVRQRPEDDSPIQTVLAPGSWSSAEIQAIGVDTEQEE